MNIDAMRKAIMSVYPGGHWQKRVESMSNAQVQATYTRFLSAGKIRTN